MQVQQNIEACGQAVIAARKAGETVGLVPTMGALHEGHLSLIRAAKACCRRVAVTIFVNPIQFGPHEDFAAYPRPLEKDLELCRNADVDLVFTPSVETMYPAGARTSIHVAGLSDGLCGPFRPGHFDGVATVVAKLFNILPADAAFFGEKDYQQLQVIRRMVRDLNLPIEIVGCPTVREPDGLAMSSRNVYLNPEQRQQAVSLSRALFAATAEVRGGERDPGEITRRARASILAAGPATIEYLDVVDAESLALLTTIDRPARMCLAVRIGTCRLIDNVALDGPMG
jgi:pantoate--beta-alanine ligase